MIDLERHLEEYGTFHDEQWGPITSEDMLAGFVSTTSTNRRLPPSTSRRIWVAAAAAVTTILVFSLLPLLVTGDEPPVADGVVPTTLAEPTPTTLAVPIASGWSRVPHDEAVFGGEGEQSVSSVTVGGPGFVAVGWDDTSAAVWTSPDGFTWSRVAHDETVFGGAGFQGMTSVTVGGPGLVAIGHDRPGNWPGSDIDALWISVDGLSWTRVSGDQDVFKGGGANGVTAGVSGLVAVGSDGLSGEQGATDHSRAVVWTSVDGIGWSRVRHDETLFGGGGAQGMFDVAVGGPGLVAVGVADQGAPVWTSADGVTWSRVPNDEAAFALVHMKSVIAGGPGLVAFGDAPPTWMSWAAGGLKPSNVPAVWTSADGIRWLRVPDDEAVFRASDDVIDVIAGGPGLVAVGSEGGNGAVWVWEAED